MSEEIALGELTQAAAENNAAAAKSAETQAKLVELGLTGGGEPVDVSAWRVAWEADYGYGNNAMFDKPQKPIGNLTIPNGIECIGYGRFNGCGVRGELRIPPSVKTLRGYSFHNNEISKIVFEGDIEKIEPNAFQMCESLESVTFPEDAKNLKEIPDNCFDDCSMLSQINIPKSVTRIGRGAFSVAFNLAEITLPSSLEYIGASAFEGAPLSRIVFPSSLLHIDYRAFAEADNLTEVLFESPSRLTHLGGQAFAFTPIVNIDLPQSVKVIDDECFSACEKLETITIPQQLERIGERAFSECGKLLPAWDELYQDILLLPPTLTEIGSEAFRQCESLKQIVIQSEDITIGNYAFDETDLSLFFSKKTMAEVRAMDNFPWGFQSGTAIMCSDGSLFV